MQKFLISDGSDLLSDAAAWRGGYISRLEKKYGCELRFSHIDEAAARALSRREGDYCTVTGSAAARALAYAMRRLARGVKVLVAGLGNSSFVSDAFGADAVNALRRLDRDGAFLTVLPEVRAVTGVDSADVIASLAGVVKPDLVIAADALATTDWRKIGACYQLTTAGIRPGSGTSAGGKCIDGDYIGTRVLAVGVPLICAVDTTEGQRSVIPYDAESVVGECANTIAAAIFAAYSRKHAVARA